MRTMHIANLSILPALLFIASGVLSAQSAVTGTINSATIVNNGAALAVGTGSYAGLGGAYIQGSKFNGTLNDTSTLNNVAALGVGTNAAAWVAGTAITANSDVSGT